MDRKVISKRIGDVLDDVSRLSNTLYAMNLTDLRRYSENYELLSVDAALRAESIACRLRGLVFACTGVKKDEYLSSAGVIHGISIDQLDGVLTVTMPGLLPKRKRHKGTEFFTGPLHNALERYSREHAMPYFRHCVVCFSHIYCRDLPARRIRDYDNLEQKQILDIVTSFVLYDDGGLLCDAYNTTELGDTDCICISLMDKSRFQGWLAEREKDIKLIEDF